MIEVAGLRYAYRSRNQQWALDGIDLTIGPGEYVLIGGSSGSGKSTLCRTFNGLIPHFYGGEMAGSVRVCGAPTADRSVAELFDRVGLVFQNAEAQLFNSTVEREIAFGLESLGLPRAEIRQRIGRSAELTGVEPLLARNPHTLSGGEQQLVAITAVLALRPQWLALDEPYAHLDPAHVRRVRAVLKEIQGQGIGVVVCEHRLQHAVADADRMVVLHQGRVVRDGPPADVLSQDVAQFGLEAPLAVQVGRQAGLSPLPLDVAAVKTAVAADSMQAVSPEPLAPEWQPEALEPPPDNAETLLRVDHLSFVLDGAPILRDVSLRLRRGECLAIVGANGAGKTTLLKHLNGLLHPTEGRVRVAGRDTRRAKVSELAGHVGMAFQNPNDQFFKLTVWDEITVGARALGRYDEAWLQDVVKLFQLEPLLERSPYRLSEGEKKRVAFAAALAARPAILVLDEPTAGQDWRFRRALGELLAGLRDRGQAIILVTHDLAFAEQQAHRWLLLAGGEVVAEGRPWQVMADGEAMRRAGLEPTPAFRLCSYEARR